MGTVRIHGMGGEERREFSVVGKRIPRPDAYEKCSGIARYTVDIKLPGMLIGKVLRSPYPHARILKIDKSKAEKLPGVEAVITTEDVPKKLFNGTFTIYKLSPERAKREIEDRYVLSEKARFVGDGIAAVAAIDGELAEKALELIEVEFEELPAHFDPLEAMKPGASRIHDFAERNIAEHMAYPFARGDVERGFQEADCIVEETFSTSKQKHCQLELDSCVASFGPNGRLTVWSPCTQIHLSRRRIASLFNLAEGMVRVITPYVGGAFGGRSNFNAEPICIALAQKTGKPVKLEYSSEEDFTVHMSRQPFIQTGKIGVRKDGTITALQTVLVTNGGAYFETSGATTAVNMVMFGGLYRCENVAGEADIVYTNTPVSGGFRGYGNPQGIFVLEQIIDMAAEKIGMDPLEFRLKNHRRIGDPSWWPTIPILSCALDECISVGAERIDWKKKRAEKKEGLRRRGVGMAVMMHPSNVYPLFMEHSSASIKLNEDGSATVIVGASEQGQGTLAVVKQIAAEELGVGSENVRVVTGDTDITPFDMGTYGSRTTYVLGHAVHGAAREAKGQILARAAKMLEVSTNELEIGAGQIYVREQPEKGISVAEVARASIYDQQGEASAIVANYSYNPASSAPSFQAAFAEVEVDTETGEVTVLKVVIAHDIGRAINPAAAEGQLEGSVVQGIGYALTEDFVVDSKTGKTLSDSFLRTLQGLLAQKGWVSPVQLPQPQP
jgi:xanthine dehydrogenase molybdenum-binding subunit